MMTQPSAHVPARDVEIHGSSAIPAPSKPSEPLHPGAGAPFSHALPGRQALGPMLERSFPGVFQSLADLRRIPDAGGWQAAIRSLGAVSMRVAAAVRTWRERSHERWVLARMSERELHDMGLSRMQIVHEVNKPFWRA